MIGSMMMASALTLWQAMSPELQQAIQEQVQEELRRGRFRGGFGPGPGVFGAFIPVLFFALIVLMVWLVQRELTRRRQAELQARTEFQKQILERFSSGKEFAEFLGTEASQRFFATLASPAFGPHYRALGMMRGGIALAVLGLGFLLLTALRRGFVVPGVIFLAIGAGLLISVAASYHYSKKWGSGGPGTPGEPLSPS